MPAAAAGGMVVFGGEEGGEREVAMEAGVGVLESAAASRLVCRKLTASVASRGRDWSAGGTCFELLVTTGVLDCIAASWPSHVTREMTGCRRRDPNSRHFHGSVGLTTAPLDHHPAIDGSHVTPIFCLNL